MFYPVYAVLFADAGLSSAEISSLFVLWSVTGFAVDVPSGLWADVFSRRLLLTVAPGLTATGYALWTLFPSYLFFALGFVLWGAGGSLRSGALQALVYDELERLGATGAYGRLIGRSQAMGTSAVMAATALAAPVMHLGGYHAVGIVSVAVTLLGVPVGRSFPESRGGGEAEEGFTEVLRAGLGEIRGSAAVRRCLIVVAAVSGVDAMDEYVPLLVRATGVSAPTLPLLVLLITVGVAAGGWLGGRGARWAGPALAVGAVCLAAGAVSGRPAGLVAVAVAFGVFQWAMVAADLRLQERIEGRARATITSMAGFGVEVVAVLTFAGYALGSAWAGPGVLFAFAAVPYAVIALVMRWTG
ncbi:MFS transporter [Actinomadura sp. DC4]|uniref:MFS transporter n=1 Tax=Actinomadura sp. DC4 TaxID=3055069 RepID=UPI0025B1ACE5|nr:MFS transporter [Actinomadura sp. DC4]MDN3359338.1 MFS transporter [Actinomadura sp. DC4]